MFIININPNLQSRLIKVWWWNRGRSSTDWSIWFLHSVISVSPRSCWWGWLSEWNKSMVLKIFFEGLPGIILVQGSPKPNDSRAISGLIPIDYDQSDRFRRGFLWIVHCSEGKNMEKHGKTQSIHQCHQCSFEDDEILPTHPHAHTHTHTRKNTRHIEGIVARGKHRLWKKSGSRWYWLYYPLCCGITKLTFKGSPVLNQLVFHGIPDHQSFFYQSKFCWQNREPMGTRYTFSWYFEILPTTLLDLVAVSWWHRCLKIWCFPGTQWKSLIFKRNIIDQWCFFGFHPVVFFQQDTTIMHIGHVSWIYIYILYTYWGSFSM